MRTVITRLVKRYQKRAADRAIAGRRPQFGSCEVSRGGHCSTLFLKDLDSKGPQPAMRNYFRTCPRGVGVAAKGLVFAAGLAILPVLAWDPNDEPCFAGSPAECP